MQTASDADIRLLTVDDLEGALRLSSDAGWNQRPADWRMLLRLAPTGCFTATLDHRIVATAIGIDYGGFGWIAMMLVDPVHRGRGFGARLLEAAMGSLPADRPVRLDATPMGRPLYQRHGFEDEAKLTRHIAASVSVPAFERAAVESSGVRRITKTDLDPINEVDRSVFGGRRDMLLDWALDGSPEYARIIQTPGGLRYCFGRAGRLFDQVGPVVSDDDGDARILMAAEGKAAVADVFDARRDFAEWLHRCGFTAQRPLFRMCRRGDARWEGRNGDSPREYTIFGPEFG